MKIDTNGNIYTFIYAAVMVIIVAAGLAFTAIKLQPLQENNVKVEKMQNILQSVGIESTVESAQTQYDKYITKQIVVNIEGEEIIGEDAFTTNLKTQFKAKEKFPVYFAKLEDGSERTVLRIPAPLAPVKAAILPLVKKDGLPEMAHKLLAELQYEFNCQYDKF